MIKDEKRISLMDEMKAQTEILLPVLHGLRGIWGKEKADAFVSEILKKHVRSVYHAIGERKTGCPKEKWTKVWEEVRPRTENNVEREILRDDAEGRDYNVNSCRFADFFREIGEPELGVLLMCDFDGYIAEIGAPEVELTRTQTIMEGAEYCDFCYRFKTKE